MTSNIDTANDLLDYRESELYELPDARLYELLTCMVPDSFSKLSQSFADTRKAFIARLLSWRKLYAIDGHTLPAVDAKPLFIHDCTACQLVRANANGRDWYICCHVSPVQEKHASVLIRTGDDTTEDYSSINVAVLQHAFVRGDSNLEPYLNVLHAARFALKPIELTETCDECGRQFTGTGTSLCGPCAIDLGDVE